MTEKPMLLGLETEYAISGLSGAAPVPPEYLAELLCDQARKRMCHLPDLGSRSGVFFSNSARLYSDIGHPEYATPECFTPGQVVLYDLAGEQVLHRLAKELLRENHFTAVRVRKNNVCSIQSGGATWGNHESYTSWVSLERAARALIPFLVTRLPFAGAGCLSANPAGMGFELSQRSQYLVEEVGHHTTMDRAIFCTRIRKSSDASADGWIRIHLICKDSNRGPLGTFLTVGVTGLLIWILNHGGRIGRKLELANAVEALHAVSLDPWLKTKLPLADSRQLTPLEVQEIYLAECERFAQRHPLPDWGVDILALWRSTLAALAEDPLDLAGDLDAYTKLFVYGHELKRHRATWQDAQRGFQLLSRIRQIHAAGAIQALLGENSAALSVAEMPTLISARQLVQADGPGALDRLQLALRLQALDLQYHELGGLYEQLMAQQPSRRFVLRRSLIDRAMIAPPPGGRAALRAAEIKAHHGQPGWFANWQYVINREDRTAIDLRNPFDTNPKKTTFDALEASDHRSLAELPTQMLRRPWRQHLPADDVISEIALADAPLEE